MIIIGFPVKRKMNINAQEYHHETYYFFRFDFLPLVRYL